ncbi:MAG: hypothetical protein ACM3ON_03830 [Chloroflexota bacterium]
MLVRDKKHFTTGAAMAMTFIGLFILILSPVFGGGMNGLEYADDIFNKLSKGSSYFIPKLVKGTEKTMGKQINVTISYDSPEDAQRTAGLLSAAGATVQQQGGTLSVSGDLGNMLMVVLKDSENMYRNEGDKVKSVYGYDERKVMKDWWTALNKTDKALQNAKQFALAKAIADVVKKGVEPSYNFYQIQPQNVTDRVGTMAGLLVFYVVYTIWWGYALYHLFEGLGLTTKKVKVKKEL